MDEYSTERVQRLVGAWRWSVGVGGALDKEVDVVSSRDCVAERKSSGNKAPKQSRLQICGVIGLVPSRLG